MRKLYRKLLSKLCRIELRKIADRYLIGREELIRYHYFMAINSYDFDSRSPINERVLNMSLSTAKELEKNALTIKSNVTPV